MVPLTEELEKLLLDDLGLELASSNLQLLPNIMQLCNVLS